MHARVSHCHCLFNIAALSFRQEFFIVHCTHLEMNEKLIQGIENLSPVMRVLGQSEMCFAASFHLALLSLFFFPASCDATDSPSFVLLIAKL